MIVRAAHSGLTAVESSGQVGTTMPRETQVLDADGIRACLESMAAQIAARAGDGVPLVLVGIHTRGVPVAARLRECLAGLGVPAGSGALDIALHRDDHGRRKTVPVVRITEIHAPVDGARVVLCDDVLFTGRTIGAALDGLRDLGRPARVELAVLVDRGHRELPIQANVVGLRLETTRAQHIRVRLAETDGADGVFLLEDP